MYMVCTSSNKFLLGVNVKYCQFPRHKCFYCKTYLQKNCTTVDTLVSAQSSTQTICIDKGRNEALFGGWQPLIHSVRQSTLQMFTGVYPAISMEKGCKNHRETLYSSKGKIVYVVGKPCNIYRLWGNPIVIPIPWLCISSKN